MVVLNNYRIVKFDKLNWTFEIYEETKATHMNKFETKMVWKKTNLYYPTVEDCLKGIKRYVKNTYGTEVEEIDEYIKLLEELEIKISIENRKDIQEEIETD